MAILRSGAVLVGVLFVVTLFAPAGAKENHRITSVTEGFGTACSFDGLVGPPSYSTRDVGRPRVPHLAADDAAMMSAIAKYVHSVHLRFAYVDGTFVEFRATVAQLCDPDVPPFVDLSGPCNEYYAPLNPWPIPGDGCVNPPRPWIKNDGGTGTGSWAAMFH